MGDSHAGETVKKADLPELPNLTELEQIASWLHGLAHPTRLQILGALRGTERLSPKQLSQLIEPEISLGTASHHTRELLAAGLVAADGTQAVRGALRHFYRLSPRGREVLELVDRLVPHASKR